MSKRDTRPIEVGDRFETRDARDAGRVVEVVAAIEDVMEHDRARRAGRLSTAYAMEPAELEEWLREREVKFHVRTEAHPRNPVAVDNISRIAEHTLRTKYKRVSR